MRDLSESHYPHQIWTSRPPTAPAQTDPRRPVHDPRGPSLELDRSQGAGQSKRFYEGHKRLVACVAFAVAIALPLADAAVTARAVFTAARDAGESAGEAKKLAAGFRAAKRAQRGKFNLAASSGSVGSLLLSQATGGCL
jgi:hypothetical protein